MLSLALGAAGAFAQEALAARVNGAPITDHRLDRYFEEYLGRNNRNVAAIRRPDVYESLRRQALEELIDEELLWQEAKRRHLVAPAKQVDEELAGIRARYDSDLSFDLRLEQKGFTRETYRGQLERMLSARRLIETIVAKAKVTPAEVHAFYVANPAQFTRPVELRVRRVLVSVKPGEPEEAKAKARARAEEALAKIRGGADFAEVARQTSDDDGFGGGDLGFIVPERLPEEVQQALGSLADGEVSNAIEAPDGFHVVRVEERRGGDLVAEETVREPIREHLLRQRREEAVRERISRLREKGKIEYGSR